MPLAIAIVYRASGSEKLHKHLECSPSIAAALGCTSDKHSLSCNVWTSCLPTSNGIGLIPLHSLVFYCLVLKNALKLPMPPCISHSEENKLQSSPPTTQGHKANMPEPR